MYEIINFPNYEKKMDNFINSFWINLTFKGNQKRKFRENKLAVQKFVITRDGHFPGWVQEIQCSTTSWLQHICPIFGLVLPLVLIALEGPRFSSFLWRKFQSGHLAEKQAKMTEKTKIPISTELRLCYNDIIQKIDDL